MLNSFQAFASKEVILSAGAINSPQLLMLSGIGNADDLKKLGIPVVCHLPGNFIISFNLTSSYGCNSKPIKLNESMKSNCLCVRLCGLKPSVTNQWKHALVLKLSNKHFFHYIW